jgi:hypothetical protein
MLQSVAANGHNFHECVEVLKKSASPAVRHRNADGLM